MDIVKPEYLFMPTAKDTDNPPGPITPTIDHFKCYKVSRTRFQTGGLDVRDQFVDQTLDIKKPVRLCLPADKNGEGIIDAATQLLCFKIKPSRGTTAFRGVEGAVFVENQFGPDVFEVFRPTELCVPTIPIP